MLLGHFVIINISSNIKGGQKEAWGAWEVDTQMHLQGSVPQTSPEESISEKAKK